MTPRQEFEAKVGQTWTTSEMQQAFDVGPAFFLAPRIYDVVAKVDLDNGIKAGTKCSLAFTDSVPPERRGCSRRLYYSPRAR